MNYLVQQKNRSHEMMNKSVAVLMMVCASFLSACEKAPDTYPISGEQCGPEDPVKDLTPPNCF